MADVKNLVIGSTTVGANYEKFANAQSDVGRELIISATKSGGLSNADLLAVYRQLTLSGGKAGELPSGAGDAFTLSSVGTATGARFIINGSGNLVLASDETTPVTTVYFKAQGTGTPDLDTVSGVTLAVVAVFAPAK